MTLAVATNIYASSPRSGPVSISELGWQRRRNSVSNQVRGIACKLSSSDASEGNESPRVENAPAMSPLEKAMAYKKAKQLRESSKSNPALNRAASYLKSRADPEGSAGAVGAPIEAEASPPEADSSAQSVPNVDDRIAAGFDSMDIYQKQQEELIAALKSVKKESGFSSYDNTPSSTSASKPATVEIITRDGVITREIGNPEDYVDNNSVNKSNRISDSDFLGLEFAEKKNYRNETPAGLRAPMSMPTGSLPEVEIITRDTSNTEGDPNSSGDLYKPKVSTWGVFPRPKNISRTFGGGRNIPPGSSLETEEEKIAAQKRTKELLAEYMRKSGLEIDPKTKATCDEAMRKGENLMDIGKLDAAIKHFEEITELTVFKSEIHGRALLMKALCLDSLAKNDEARVLYEKLSTHPNDKIRKRTKNMLFGFQAAENLKVRGGYDWDVNVYRKYFDRFANDYNTSYKRSDEEREADERNDKPSQYLPYFLLAFSPIFLVFILAYIRNK